MNGTRKMKRLDPAAVLEVKNSADLREIAARYGFEVTRAGFICCPFHVERTPSCRLTASRFYCFGCGARGDALDFLQQLTGRSFSDCFELLGGRLDGDRDPLQAEAEQLRREIARAAREERRRILSAEYRANCWRFLRLQDMAALLTPPKNDADAAELGRLLGQIAQTEQTLDDLAAETREL